MPRDLLIDQDDDGQRRMEDECSPIMEKWLASHNRDVHDNDADEQDEDELQDDFEANTNNNSNEEQMPDRSVGAKKPSLKERLAAASSSMRPSRYLPMSYKPMTAFPSSASATTFKRKLNRGDQTDNSENIAFIGNSFSFRKQKGTDKVMPRLNKPQTPAGMKRLGRPSSSSLAGSVSPSLHDQQSPRRHPQISSSPRKKQTHTRRIENSLSPPPRSSSGNRPSLTREERKLQMYIETIQRIEARESKKRKSDTS